MTKFKNVPIDIVGSSYKSRSLSISAQTTKNLYPEITITGKVQKSLHSWPGSKYWSPSVAKNGRGTYVMNEVLYQVAGDTLYSVDMFGTKTSLGTIAGANPVVMIDDENSNLIITTGGSGYVYSTSSGLQSITDTDFQNGNSCAYLNRQAIYDGNGGKFQVSDVGDTTSINALNFATAESSPDDTIRVYVKDQLLYLFGKMSFEIWYNSGVGTPPFDRIQGGVRDVGLISPYAVTGTPETIYFMGDDKRAYKMIGYREQSITSSGVAYIFDSFEMSDCRASHVSFFSNEIVVFAFPTEGRVFAYHETADYWFELTNGANESAYFISSYVEAYGMRLVEDKRNGAIHVLDFNSFDNLGQEMIRERVTSPISGDALNMPGQRLLMDRIRFVVEKGVGLPTGQGSDPVIAVSLSFDGGNSWTNEHYIDVYETGERLLPVDFYYSMEFYELMIKIRMSDPVFLSLHNASIDISPVGGY